MSVESGAKYCEEAQAQEARRALLDELTADRLAHVFSALADPTRVRILSALVGAEELCVGDLAAVLELSMSAVSHQLRLLRELRVTVAGVVENMRRFDGDGVETLALRHGFPFLGAVPFDPTLEEAVGDVGRLKEGAVFGAVDRVVARLGW